MGQNTTQQRKIFKAEDCVMIWDHTGLFLLRNQSHDSMTLCELLHQVAWDDIRPHIVRHLPERPETKLADYKRLFELARETAPDRTTYIPRTPLTFRFYRNPDTLSCEWNDLAHDTINYFGSYVADHAFGGPLSRSLASRIEKFTLPINNSEWAAFCLWELLRYYGEDDNSDAPKVRKLFPLFRRLVFRWNDWRFRRMTRRFRMDQNMAPKGDKRLQRLRCKVQQVEASILKITGREFFTLTQLSEKKINRVYELIGDRKWLLDQMFVGTPEEVARMKAVNERLLELTSLMYRRSAALYRKVLTCSYDADFDDDVMVEGILKYSYNEESSLLPMSNDAFYGSDFCRMMQVIDGLYGYDIVVELEEIKSTLCKNFDPHDQPEMSDAELGFKDELDDGTAWAEGALWHPAFKNICLCHAVHDICTHKNYSIPDLLRMNDFWCEVKVTHQHIVDQGGNRWEWWRRCTFEEFRSKLLSEAEHRPEHIRLGQYIMTRTLQLFPDEATSPLWDGLDDCFYLDERVDSYLHRLYDRLNAPDEE